MYTPAHSYLYCILQGNKRVHITVKPQWLEHRWLVYHGLLELVFESLGNTLESQRKLIFMNILENKNSYFIMKCMLYELIALESPQHAIIL